MKFIDNEKNKKLKKLYKASKKKSYKEKDAWEKFLDDDRRTFKRKQKEIRKNEILLSLDVIEYLQNKDN